MDDDDKLIYKDDSATLSWLGFGLWLIKCVKNAFLSQLANQLVLIENETELSFFNRDAYEEYKKHPDTKWWFSILSIWIFLFAIQFHRHSI